MKSDCEFSYNVFDHLSQQKFVDLCNVLLLRVVGSGYELRRFEFIRASSVQ